MTREDLKATVLGILNTDSGLTPEAVADAIVEAVMPQTDSAPALNEGSRDETHDSIDPATGTLTDEAIAKRAAMAAQLTADQADDDVAAAEEAAAEAEEAGDEQALAEAKDKVTAAKAKKAAADAKVQADKDALASEAPAGDAMVTVGPEQTSEGPAPDQPVTLGEVTTTADLQG